MKIWKAHYKDEKHDLDIDIINTEGDYSSDPLSFCINGFTFVGTSIGDFRLADSDMYEEAKKEFCIMKWGGRDEKYNIQSEYQYDLQRYALDVKIPINVIRKNDNCIIEGYLQICFEYHEHDIKKNQCIIKCDGARVYRDDEKVTVFTLYVDGEQYCAKKPGLYFETCLLELSKMIKDKYELKCCFMCQYSDYSPYGNDDFGTMLCYKRHKAEYLKVNDKDGYFEHLEGLDCDVRQETYLCEEYEQRIQCEGYRGFVK